MIIRNKITIIGQSNDLVKTFNYFFKGKILKNISFRKAWKNLNLVKNSEIIVISGFHHEICNLSNSKLKVYINNYHSFLLKLKNKCSNVYIISTDLKFKYSLSRVLYFYYLLNQKIQKRDNLNIVSFETIYGFERGLLGKIKIFIYKFLNINIFHYKKINIKFQNSKKKIITKKIKFFLIKIPRSRKTDRLIRFFVDIILFNFIFKFLTYKH